MFDSYAESVLHYADDRGNLDADIAQQLLDEHSTSFSDILQDGFPSAHILNAAALLDWLGY